MPTYKLTYFNVKGRGEVIRLLFTTVGQKFEDKRVEFPEWQELKPKVPQGTLPVLEIDGGKLVVSQSMAISRYLAREYKLYGKNSTETLLIDEIVDTLTDLFDQMAKSIREKDETKKAELEKTFGEETAPRYLAILEKTICGKDGFAVGSSLSLADLVIFNHLEVPGLHAKLDKYPKLKASKAKVECHKNISKYLKSRPVTKL